MNIGIIGAGNIGSALAVHLRRLQHTVLIANSRGPETLSEVAQKTGATPVDISWRHQPGTMLLQRADRDKAPRNRDRGAKIMAKLPPGFSPQELVRVARLSAGLDTWRPRSWIAVLHLGLATLCA